ncbi:uncharacterized protein I303_107489 [Kwoniella dejecticola CBS 10117]|uniref:Uncharacterized protein n=1 Tax=Kwoniella dejecticola CBS 10117 TaxID=1296121 RepID=A0A1A5ZZV1_9TREE|nr:uncharacterized protein I303_06894 [Kwoniella dejecticola CBS 10117]OBR83329.1 hypothetical protein I303_06894 [Kwoniella dejecticola CBS 10117]
MSDVSEWVDLASYVPKAIYMGGRSSHYGLTDAVVRNSGIAANVAAAFSLATTLGFLGTSIWVYSYPTCRHTLDRVSFRLLVVAMFWEFWYSFIFLMLYINDTIYLPGHTLGPHMCTTGVYFLVSAMSTVDLLVMFIALNLFLTINMGINPVKLYLERWYIGISLLLGFMIPLGSAIKQHFGWDYALGTCWINGYGRHQRLVYLLEGIYITPIITCTVSTICVAAVLVVLFRQGRATSKALFGGVGGKQQIHDNLIENENDVEDGSAIGTIDLDPLSTASGSDPLSSSNFTSTMSPDSNGTATTTMKEGINRRDGQSKGNRTGVPVPVLWKLKEEMNNFARGKGWHTTEELHSRQRQSYFHSLSDKFLSIAIKIAWYPITLLFINAILMIGDLVIAAQGGARSKKTVWLYCVYYFFYGGRGICIAGLAIIIDPSLVRGMKAAWRERRISRNTDSPLPTTTADPASTLSPLDDTPTYGRTPYPTIIDQSQTQTQTQTQTQMPLNSGPGQADAMMSTNTRSRVDSDGSFDFATALASIPKPPNAQARGRDRGRDSIPAPTPTAALPTVEVDESYLSQELDTTILDGPNADAAADAAQPQIPRTRTSTSSYSPSTTSNRPTTAKKASMLLDRFPAAATTYRPLHSGGGGGGGGRTKMRIAKDPRTLDPEQLRRKEEQRRREERVKEIKKRFEEVQKHL